MMHIQDYSTQLKFIKFIMIIGVGFTEGVFLEQHEIVLVIFPA